MKLFCSRARAPIGVELRLFWQLPVNKLPSVKNKPSGSDALFPQVERADVLVWAPIEG